MKTLIGIIGLLLLALIFGRLEIEYQKKKVSNLEVKLIQCETRLESKTELNYLDGVVSLLTGTNFN